MKRTLLATLMAALTAALCGCSESKPVAASNAAVPAAQAAPAPATQPLETTFLASGPLVVENQVDVAALREGVVAKTMAEPGLRVKTGQLLALLDDRQVGADLAAARAKSRSIQADLHNWEAEAKVLESDHERAQKMWDAGLITKEQLDHARYKAESDKWDVERVAEMLHNARESERSLELELEKTRVRAPFGGVVARRYVRAGQKVAVGDRLFWVTAEGPLRVKFTLPERFLGKVQKGAQVSVSSPDSPQRVRKARVIEVSPVVDPSSGTIEVLAQLEGPAGELRPGMMANVRVENTR